MQQEFYALAAFFMFYKIANTFIAHNPWINGKINVSLPKNKRTERLWQR